jgi:hypothetical protein
VLNAQPATNQWAAKKAKEVKDLVVAASGLWAEVITNRPSVVQGDTLQFSVALNDRLGTGVDVKRLQMGGLDTTLSASLEKNKNLVINKKLAVPLNKELTQPYWLREPMQEGYYEVSDQTLIGQPDVEKAFVATMTLSINGETINITRPLQYKYSDQVKGEIYQPFVVLPPATLSMSPGIVLFQKGGDQKHTVTEFLTAQKALQGTAQPHIRSAAIDSTMAKEKLLLPAMATQSFPFLLSGKDLQNRTTDKLFGSVAINTAQGEQTAYLSRRTISYDHIPTINYFFGSASKLLNIDLKTEGKKIGYIVGAGDKVPEALEQMGYDVTLLTDKELERNNLKQFDAIIAGVRAFNANGWMDRFYTRLMTYVEEGGNYIVQYSQNNNIRGKMGPYNFAVSNKRITDENAAVTMLAPEHPALNYPNKITEADFRGWIQERSIYHADAWDQRYQAILRMNDPGEQPNDGSLIIAKYGKGFFTYTGLVFFRELPAGVPGAYRLMANLIALNKIKGM